MPETEKTVKQQLKENSDTVNGAYDYWIPETKVVPVGTALAIFKEWIEQGTEKANYLTDEELKMDKEHVDLQVVLGLQTCKTKADVCKLLDDIRLHERLQLVKELER